MVTAPVSPAADGTRAFPRLASNLKGGAGRDTASTATLDNVHLGAAISNWIGSAFDIERATGAEANLHRYYSECVEDILPDAQRPAHGFHVRRVDSERLNAAVTSLTTGVVPGIVDLGQCVAWSIASRSSFAGQEWSDAAATVELDGLGRVVLTRGQALGSSTQSFAVLEFGSAWTRHQATLTTAVRGADIAITGCGSEPWGEKFYLATWRAPGADSVSDVPLFRASESNPDELIFMLPTLGTIATYTVNVYVLRHPLLAVQHWNSIDRPELGDLATMATDTLILIPSPVTGFEDQVSLIGTADHDAANLGYPRMHIGWSLEAGGTHVRARRGRVTDRPSHWALQAIRWPEITDAAGGSRGGFGYTAISGRL